MTELLTPEERRKIRDDWFKSLPRKDKKLPHDLELEAQLVKDRTHYTALMVKEYDRGLSDGKEMAKEDERKKGMRIKIKVIFDDPNKGGSEMGFSVFLEKYQEEVGIELDTMVGEAKMFLNSEGR